MSIFRREPSAEDDAPRPATRPAPASGEPSRRTTYVAPGSKLVGLIAGTAEVLVEGELEGEVKIDNRVVIGPPGKVRGNILARSVRIAGHLFGNVRGLERVELTSSASLEGNLAAPRVVIADGAFFKGEVEMAVKRPEAGKGREPARTASDQPGASGSARAGDEDRDTERG